MGSTIGQCWIRRRAVTDLSNLGGRVYGIDVDWLNCEIKRMHSNLQHGAALFVPVYLSLPVNQSTIMLPSKSTFGRLQLSL